MSAIFGIIDLNRKKVDSKVLELINPIINGYKIDKNDNIIKDNVLMVCGHQFITKESENEVLPYLDESNNLVITSDAILDNREELIKELNLADTKISDSKIILLMYQKYKEACVDKFLGNYSFVIYDFNNNNIFAVKDSTGSRSLYYHFKNNIFYFSTSIEPIKEVIKNVSLNEKWICDFLTLKGMGNTVEIEETIYNEILQVNPATYIKINNQGIHKTLYWDPMKDIKILKLKNDEEYKKLFISTFKEAVKSSLRTNRDVASFLSGGLDSTSIVCLAADFLKKDNKCIKTYTSIPMKKYEQKCKDDINEYYVTNEEKMVQLTAMFKDNVVPNFCRSENVDSVSNIEKLLECVEEPYKTIQNNFWMDQVVKKASEDNCKVLLTGQFGNATISYGNFYVQMKTLFEHFRFITMIKEINALHEKVGVRRKEIIKNIINYLEPNCFIKRKFNMEEFFKDSIASREIIDSTDAYKRFNRDDIVNIIPWKPDLNRVKRGIVDLQALSQIGNVETKFSLKYGLMIRDPSRDKRIIKLCLSLPGNQFVDNGVERKLIRTYMKDLIPDEIRNDIFHRGLQSADWIFRLNDKRDEVYNLIDKAINSPLIEKYIDKNKVCKQFDKIKAEINLQNQDSVKLLLLIVILEKYINKLNEEEH